ncbi:hypothetical protein GC56T2_2813 [Geobacillus sp. C56-T2]|nr:hypothetical protein GC56T2_2813 [Geobacillus sp. C56-T2]
MGTPSFTNYDRPLISVKMPNWREIFIPGRRADRAAHGSFLRLVFHTQRSSLTESRDAPHFSKTRL